MAGSKTDFRDLMTSLEDNLSLYLVKKAPALPDQWRELIVKLAPIFAIIGAVLGVLALPALLGLSALMAPLGFLGGTASGQPFFGISMLISIIFLIVILVLEIMSIPGLLAKKENGWKYAYYAVLVSALDNVIHFNIAGLIIGTLLGLYILFQVKSYYK